jgi:hypothetical protein
MASRLSSFAWRPPVRVFLCGVGKPITFLFFSFSFSLARTLSLPPSLPLRSFVRSIGFDGAEHRSLCQSVRTGSEFGVRLGKKTEAAAAAAAKKEEEEEEKLEARAQQVIGRSFNTGSEGRKGEECKTIGK